MIHEQPIGEDCVLDPWYLTPKQQRLCAALCEDLRRKDSNALGFVPRATYTAAIKRRRLIMKFEGTEELGFCFFGISGRFCNVYQIAVRPDARRFHHAADLIAALPHHFALVRTDTITLKCRADLEANLFWQALGFRLARTFWTGNARRHPINRWVLDWRAERLSFPFDP